MGPAEMPCSAGLFSPVPDRRVRPRRKVTPPPPMWVAAGNPETFEKAGRAGLGVLCFTGGAPAEMAPLIETYKKATPHPHPVGEVVHDNAAGTTSLMCLVQRERGRRLITHSGHRRPQAPGFHLPH